MSNDTKFLFAKSIIKKSKTVPDAELNAILLGLKFLPLLFKIIQPHQTISFSDSKINIDRVHIKNINCLASSIAIKVLKIREVFRSTKTTLHHVISERNPADFLTKLDKYNWQDWIQPHIDLPCVNKQPFLVNSVSSETMTSMTIEEAENIILEISSTSTSKEWNKSKEEIILASQIFHWKDNYFKVINDKLPSKDSELFRYLVHVHENIIMIFLRSSIDNSKIFIPHNATIIQHLLKEIALFL